MKYLKTRDIQKIVESEYGHKVTLATIRNWIKYWSTKTSQPGDVLRPSGARRGSFILVKESFVRKHLKMKTDESWPEQ